MKQRLVEFLDAEAPSADEPGVGARYKGLIINRYFGGGAKDGGKAPISHSFIELYNNNSNGQTMNLKGLCLYYKNLDDGVWRRFELKGYVPYQHSFLVRCGRVNSKANSSCRYEITKFDQHWEQELSFTSGMVYLGVDYGQLTIANPYNLADGTTDPDEVVNQSLIFITTAGWKNSFAYEKLITLLIQQITDPSEAVVLGGSWRIPVMEKLLKKSFIEELKLDGTYNDASFAREYESEWSGDAENAFFSAEKFDKHRVLLQPEYEFSGRSSKSAYYILGIDVGRKGCTTEVCVFKVTPQAQGTSLKTLVNLYTWDEEHFEACQYRHSGYKIIRRRFKSSRGVEYRECTKGNSVK